MPDRPSAIEVLKYIAQQERLYTDDGTMIGGLAVAVILDALKLAAVVGRNESCDASVNEEVFLGIASDGVITLDGDYGVGHGSYDDEFDQTHFDDGTEAYAALYPEEVTK